MKIILESDRWIKPLNGEVIGITIDHRLRKESYYEAIEVGEILAKWGIKHIIIPWQHEGVEKLKNVSENSRINRYRLMENYCKTHSILHLAIAHHLDDQEETIYMRKLRNPTSVKPMDAIQYMTHVRIIRPFLKQIYKQDLMDTLNSHDIKWIEDPSNKKLTYERNKIRSALQNNSDQISHDPLSQPYPQSYPQSYGELSIGDEVKYLEDIMLSHHAYGELHIKSLEYVHKIKNILSSFIMTIGANFYKLSQRKIFQACKELSQGKNISLGRCLVVIHKTKAHYKLIISREIRAIKKRKIPLIDCHTDCSNSNQRESNHLSNSILWNNTMLITIENLDHYKNDSDYHISLLSKDNMKKVKSMYEKTIFQDIPFHARNVLPCLFRSDELISILTMENNTIYIPPRPVSGKKINVQYPYK